MFKKGGGKNKREKLRWRIGERVWLIIIQVSFCWVFTTYQALCQEPTLDHVHTMTLGSRYFYHVCFKDFFFLMWTILTSLLNLLQYCFCFKFWFFWPQGLAPWLGIKPTPALKGEVNHWTIKEVPSCLFCEWENWGKGSEQLSKLRVGHHHEPWPSVEGHRQLRWSHFFCPLICWCLPLAKT